MCAKRRKDFVDSTPSPKGKCDMESSDRNLLVSTQGLLTIAASIGARPKQWRAENTQGVRGMALWVIDSIAARVGKELSDGRFSDKADLSMSFWRDDNVRLVCGNLRSTSAVLSGWLQKHLCPAGACTVGEMLLALSEVLCQKCRLSEDKLEISKECFRFVAWWLEQCMDLSLVEAAKGPGNRKKDDVQKKRSSARAKNASRFMKDVMIGYVHAGRERKSSSPIGTSSAARAIGFHRWPLWSSQVPVFGGLSFGGQGTAGPRGSGIRVEPRRFAPRSAT